MLIAVLVTGCYSRSARANVLSPGYSVQRKQILEELANNGDVGEERVEQCKTNYAALHDAVVGAMRDEKFLVDKAKSLKR